MLLDETGIAGGSNIVWHGGLEFAFAPEHHQGDELRRVQAEELLQCLGMAIILVKGVLKPVFFAEQTLCPLSTLRVTEDPAIHIFGLDDKDAVFRDDDVVNLRRAVFSLQRNVVQRDVDFGVK